MSLLGGLPDARTEETGMSVRKEYEMVALARRMDLFSIVYVGSPEEAAEMAKAGADAQSAMISDKDVADVTKGLAR